MSRSDYILSIFTFAPRASGSALRLALAACILNPALPNQGRPIQPFESIHKSLLELPKPTCGLSKYLDRAPRNPWRYCITHAPRLGDRVENCHANKCHNIIVYFRRTAPPLSSPPVFPMTSPPVTVAFIYDEGLSSSHSDHGTTAMSAALKALGHNVVNIDGLKPLISKLADLSHTKWDLALNVVEGMHGLAREAQVPCLLEAYEIPFTFADAATTSLCLDKGRTKVRKVSSTAIYGSEGDMLNSDSGL